MKKILFIFVILLTYVQVFSAVNYHKFKVNKYDIYTVDKNAEIKYQQTASFITNA
jgi:hypothetical protein